MDAMQLYIEPGSPDPIYRQLVGQISRLILAGQWPAGELLPSVREVATVHAINPMTVSKAYTLLEAQGLLERLRGKGMRVALCSPVAPSLEQRLGLLAEPLAELARQARQLGLDHAQVAAALRPLMSEND